MTNDPGMRGSSGQLPRLQPPRQNIAPQRTMPHGNAPELWLLGLVFAISLGVGLGVTLLIASMAS